MIRFVGNTADGLPQKRSQLLRACDSCRKRKKRCTHSEGHGSTGSRTIDDSRMSAIRPESASELNRGADHTLHADSFGDFDTPPVTSASFPTDYVNTNDAVSVSTDSEHFVGELNPESAFLAATTPQSPHASATDTVGVWLPRKVLEGLQTQLDGRIQNSDPLLSNILLPYMRRQCQQLTPLAADYAALYQIYVQDIHPIFPVIDTTTLEAAALDSSPSMLILRQAISLAASTSPKAISYLNSPHMMADDNDSNNQGVRLFADRLASAIRTSIDMGFVKDRLVMVQVLTILGFFTQFSRAPSASAEVTARAISQAQTMGLHLDIPSTKKNSEYLTRLFCCIWAIDKFNAAFQGRPTMIHQQDFGRDFADIAALQDGCFRLLLRVVGLLDEVITLYRPSRGQARTIVESIKIPAFEDLIHQCNATRTPYNLLGTVEILYHAVAMLSCRPAPFTQMNASFKDRELMSASSVTTIIDTEFRDQIVHLPFVPYALSLSLRVYYRELRFSSKSPFTRNRVRKQLLNACTLLRNGFSQTFPSTTKVADLAEQTVKEMDKVFVNILQQHSRATSSSARVDDVGRNEDLDRSRDSIRQAVVNSDTPSIDLTAFEGMPDLDIFEYFGSDFQLDAIDAALVDNTALSYPLTGSSSDFD